MKIRFDGKEYEAGSKEHLDAVDAYLAAQGTASAKLTAERDQAVRDRDAARADASDARDPAKTAARVAERVQLEADAKKIWAEVKFDGLTDAQVRESVVLHADSNVKVRLDSYLVGGKPGPAHDAYVRARFDAMLTAAPSGTSSVRAALVASEFTYDAAALAQSASDKPVLLPWQQDLISHA